MPFSASRTRFHPSVRLTSLDGVRGLAALMVVLSHVAAMTYAPWGGTTPTTLEFALWHLGAPAVDVFFILSGFVVTQSLLRRPAVLPYLTRRWVRLAPLAYLAVLLGLLSKPLAELAGSDFSVLVTRDLQAALTPKDLLGSLTLTFPALNANHLNPPLWTLIVELQVALLMPLFAKLSRAWWTLLPVMLITFVLALLGWTQAFFFPAFLLGAILARAEIHLPKSLVLPALLLGLVMLFQRHLTGSDDLFVRYLAMPGAALILLSVLNGAGAKLLASDAAQSLGRLSYALYATHFPVMLTVTILASNAGHSPLLGALLSLPACFIIAFVAHALIERPILDRLDGNQARMPRKHRSNRRRNVTSPRARGAREA